MFPFHETYSQLDGKLFPMGSGLFACFEGLLVLRRFGRCHVAHEHRCYPCGCKLKMALVKELKPLLHPF